MEGGGGTVLQRHSRTLTPASPVQYYSALYKRVRARRQAVLVTLDGPPVDANEPVFMPVARLVRDHREDVDHPREVGRAHPHPSGPPAPHGVELTPQRAGDPRLG